MKRYILILLLMFSSQVIPQKYGAVEGYVTDIQTGEVLIGANVIIINAKLGDATDENGYYRINKLIPGKYEIRSSFLGYQTIAITGVEIFADSITAINFELLAEEIQVGTVTIATNGPNLKKGTSNALLFLAAETKYCIPFNTEEYSKINEIGFRNVLAYPLSTFAVDVDAASYSNSRRFLMNNKLPIKGAVRIEEFINYFNYDYNYPEVDNPLSINMEYSECPWNKDHHLIQIGLKGKKLEKENLKLSNLVFLIDVSGSMSSDNKLPLLKRAFKLLVEQLKPEDKIAIVVYAGRAGLVLPSTSGSKKQIIIDSIEALESGGSTAGGAGIRLAYKVAKENFIEGGNNRVVLATDGDFNIGISSTSELVRFIEDQRDENIFLTVLGFGMGNYKDNRLQELADRGNGNHAYIDNILEAKKVLVNEINSTLYTIAKDVKIQVEFNPVIINSYRLIGYENRMLNDEDFEDDSKDAGEIGAEHTVTALYEVELNNDNQTVDAPKLKYRKTEIKPDALNSDEIMTLRIRYKEPDGDQSIELQDILAGTPIHISESSDNFRFASAAAEFAMLLRDSEFKFDSNYDSVLKLAQSALGFDKFGYRAEFVNLVKRAQLLSDK